MPQSESNESDPKYDVYNKVGHIAVLYKHFVLVWGGFQGAETHQEINKYCPTNIVWMYNTLTEIWDTITTTGDTPTDNSGSTGLILDDYLYVFGGMEQLDEEYIRYTNSLLRLNLITFVWELLHPTGEQPLSCDKGTGWVYNNKLYFFGGYGQKPTNSSWYNKDGSRIEKCSYVADWSGSRPGLKGWNNQLVCYDPSTNSWYWVLTKGRPPPPRAACDADLDNHRVFMFGGRLDLNRNNDLYILDMINKQWTHNLTLEVPGIVPFGVSWHSFKLVRPNTFILFGGLLESGAPACSWWILEVDSSLRLCWKEREMPVPLSWHKAVFSPATQELIIVGGVCVSPYEMILSDHVNHQIVIQLEPPSLFRECLQKLTLVESTTDLEILPSTIKSILSHRVSQGFLNKIRLTV